MKKLFNEVNLLGLAGMLVVGSVAFATSGFTSADSSKKQLLTYGYDASNPAAPWVQEGTAGYFCNEGEDYCKYNFDTPPSNEAGNITPREAGIPVSEGDDNLGSYQQL